MKIQEIGFDPVFLTPPEGLEFEIEKKIRGKMQRSSAAAAASPPAAAANIIWGVGGRGGHY